MKLLINTASTYKGGSVQVARSFIEECKNIKGNKYFVVLGVSVSELIDQKDYPENFTFYTLPYRPASRIFGLKSHNLELKKLEKRFNPDVAFTTSGPAYWTPKTSHLVGYNLPHYIYRDSPFFSLIPLRKRLKWDLKGFFIKYFLKKEADSYVVQTDDVNGRLQKWLNTNRVYTVSNCVSQHYESPKDVVDKLPEKEREEFRFLSLSAWYPHKNLGIIPKVIDSLPAKISKRVRFVLTLPEKDFFQNFNDNKNGRIVNVGPVKPEEGPALYKECDAMFLPTLLECFSASYAEAMKMNVPIVTSDLGFARTVCDNAALYFDPMNPKSISQKIVELMEDSSLQGRLIKNGKIRFRSFSTPSQRAELYLKICKELASVE